MNLQFRLSKALFLVALLAVYAFQSKASITTSSVSGTYACGSSITVSFSSTESFGNKYYLQISTYSDMHDVLGPLNNIGGGSTSTTPITGSLASVTPGIYYARVICYNPGPIVYGSISGPFTVGAGVGSNLANAINAGTIFCNVYSDTKTNSSAYCFSDTYDAAQNSAQVEGRASNDIWYKFTISTASNISISTCTSGLADTYLHLLNSDGSHRLSNDDRGPICSSDYRASLLYSTGNLLPAGTYYIVVEGYYTTPGSITTTITGICPAPIKPASVSSINNMESLALKVSPNPFSNTTTLKVEGGNGKATLQISNINGAVVYKNEAYQTGETITLGEAFPAGVYFVRVKDANESKILKLVKVN